MKKFAAAVGIGSGGVVVGGLGAIFGSILTLHLLVKNDKFQEIVINSGMNALGNYLWEHPESFEKFESEFRKYYEQGKES